MIRGTRRNSRDSPIVKPKLFFFVTRAIRLTHYECFHLDEQSKLQRGIYSLCLCKCAFFVPFAIGSLIRNAYFDDTCLAFPAVKHLKVVCKNDVTPVK